MNTYQTAGCVAGLSALLAMGGSAWADAAAEELDITMTVLVGDRSVIESVERTLSLPDVAALKAHERSASGLARANEARSGAQVDDEDTGPRAAKGPARGEFGQAVATLAREERGVAGGEVASQARELRGAREGAAAEARGLRGEIGAEVASRARELRGEFGEQVSAEARSLRGEIGSEVATHAREMRDIASGARELRDELGADGVSDIAEEARGLREEIRGNAGR